MRSVGLALWLCLAAPSLASAMQMQVAGDQIILSGGVNIGDAIRFKTLLAENDGKITTVVLRNSSGGDAESGYAIGDLIRSKGLRTALAGYCQSSCSRMYLGGVERIFTDEQPAGKTYVAFHSNYEANGLVKLDNVLRLQQWIIAHSDGKADTELVKRWTTIRNRHGFAYFFDSNRLHRKDGISVFLCDGSENPRARFDECEKIAGKTGYDLGIFTANTVIKVNQ